MLLDRILYLYKCGKNCTSVYLNTFLENNLTNFTCSSCMKTFVCFFKLDY